MQTVRRHYNFWEHYNSLNSFTDDKYLGPIGSVEVLTISGFLDPSNLDTTEYPQGWQFVVRSNNKEFRKLKLVLSIVAYNC